MRYTASCYEYEEADYRITDVVITKSRIAIDWIEESEPGNCVVTSTDGVVYRGNYGYPRPEPRYQVEFRLYRAADGEVLLFGRWWRTDTPDGGTWVIRLTPKTD